MPVIKMTLKKINLEDRLHTNETYQQYFRRRVANLISDYCEHQANECIGTTLRMPKVDSNYSSKPTETTTQLILDDDYEPLLTQENVVIVRVNFLPRDRVELYIVVTKTTDIMTLNEDNTMIPEKIKYILSAQIAPLSRVLGGVHIEELKTDYVQKINYESNAGLIKFLFVTFIAIAICYVVAATKCCVETRRKRRKKNANAQKYGTNYGTCTEKLLNYEKPNGKLKGNSITSRDSLSSSRKGKKSSGIRTPTIELKTPTFEDDRPSLDARSFTRMFACDPSQLPAEYMYVSPEGDNQSEDVLLHSPPLSKKHSSPITQEGPQIPSMILVSASTPIPPELGFDSSSKTELQLQQPPFKQNKQEILVTGTSLLNTNQVYNPYERPLSRRGSRNSTPEQGEEFAVDREETPSPLGDEEADTFIADKVEEENVPSVQPDIVKNEHWSSDSDSENEVYQRLSEASEGEDDERMLNDERQTTKKWKNLPKNNSSDVESNFSDEDETTKTEEEMLEGHNYKRLQESPVPAVSLPANLLQLDSSP
uniref:Uncharacterized protein n=1 Tax=Panagrolaimus sp. JU765 TaxID=591449 RepID=A0AC34RJ28_9BILA